MRFFYKPSFLKAFDRLPLHEQQLVLKTDALIKDYLQTAKASIGLRIKSLGHDIFEGRVNDRLRIVWVREKEAVTFALLGNHEEVSRFLKRL